MRSNPLKMRDLILSHVEGCERKFNLFSSLPKGHAAMSKGNLEGFNALARVSKAL